MPNEYIRAADLSTAQLEELQAHGTVEVDGSVYQLWRSDGSGPWLQAKSAAAPTGIRDVYPEIFGDYGDDDGGDDDAE